MLPRDRFHLPLPLGLLTTLCLGIGFLGAGAARAQTPIRPAIDRHALFSRLDLTESGETGPRVRLFVEAPRRADPQHVARATAAFAPWMAAIDTALRENYILPNKLERREELPELGVILLANGSSFANAARYQASPDRLSRTCLLIEDPLLIVGQWNEHLAKVPGPTLRRPILWRMTRALLDSYYHGPGEQLAEQWVVDGICGYLTAADETTLPEDLSDPPVDSGALERTLAFVRDPRGAGLLLPLPLLAGTHGASERLRIAAERAREAGVTLGRDAAERLWRDQATLWVHFFERGEGGRYRRDWQHYVAKSLHGNGSPTELTATLGTSLEELEAGFLAHLDFESGGGAGGSTPPRATGAPILHEEIYTPPEKASELLSEALGLAGGGDIEGGIELLESGLGWARGPERGTLARERDRLRSLRETRDAFLASLVGDRRRRLRWRESDGKSYSAPLLGWSEETLNLGKNKSGRESLPLRELRAGDLERSMGSHASDHGPPWIRAYLKLLSGDEHWRADLPEQTEGFDGLFEAAREGSDRIRLARLARSPLPSGAEESEAFLAEIVALWGSDTRPAQAARKGLHTLAREVLEARWMATGFDKRLHGKVSHRPDGSLRIEYDFTDPAELEDFVRADDYLAARRGNLPPLTPGTESDWKVRGGNLEGRGDAVLRHLVSFQAPVRLEYELIYGRAEPGKPLNVTLLAAVCDNGRGGYVGAWDLFDLEAIDPDGSFVRTAYHQGERRIEPARPIKVRLDHAGEKAVLTVASKRVREVATGPRTTGATLLWLHGDATLAIRRLTLQGKPAPTGDDPAMRAWVEGELKRLGL